MMVRGSSVHAHGPHARPRAVPPRRVGVRREDRRLADARMQGRPARLPVSRNGIAKTPSSAAPHGSRRRSARCSGRRGRRSASESYRLRWAGCCARRVLKPAPGDRPRGRCRPHPSALPTRPITRRPRTERCSSAAASCRGRCPWCHRTPRRRGRPRSRPACRARTAAAGCGPWGGCCA
jgi:hypothetical protein